MELSPYSNTLDDINKWMRHYLARKILEQSLDDNVLELVNAMKDDRDDFTFTSDIICETRPKMKSIAPYYYPLVKFYSFLQKNTPSKLQDIDGDYLTAFVKIELRDLYFNVQIKYYTTVKSMLTYIDSNNDNNFNFNLSAFSKKIFQKEKRLTSHLYDHEIKEFISALDGIVEKGRSTPEVVNRNKLLFKIILLTGARINEVLSLSWKHIELLEEEDVTLVQLKLYGKGRKERFAYINLIHIKDELKIMIDTDTNLGLYQDTANNVFHPYNKGKRTTPLLYPYVYRILQRILLVANVKKERLNGTHMLRHTFATKQLSLGTPLPDLSEMLGHEQLETTLKYVHADKERIKNRAKTLSFI